MLIISLKHPLKYHPLLTLPLLFKRVKLSEHSAMAQSKQWYVDNRHLYTSRKTKMDLKRWMFG